MSLPLDTHRDENFEALIAMKNQFDEYVAPIRDKDENALLKSQVEQLNRKIIDKNFTIVQMEAKMSQELPRAYAQGQLASLRATCDSWQDKYERLLEAHKRVQRVNQGLEDKLLRLVDRGESEKARMYQDTVRLTTALTTAAQAINRLQDENACYQKDLNLATQLLHCNPNQYASYKLNMLPSELHQRAKSRIGLDAPTPPSKPPKTEAKVIRVPIPTFPPSAVVYSVNDNSEEKEEENDPNDVVSAAILAAILEERERERSQRHCPTCTCELDKRGKLQPRNNTETSASHLTGKTPDKAESPFSSKPSCQQFSLADSCKLTCLSTQFDVKAIDVGTQTLPSYIGETGKVTSTCIYCHSTKTLSEMNGHIESNNLNTITVSSSIDHLANPSPSLVVSGKKIYNLTPMKSSSVEEKKSLSSGSCPWDWHPDSQDSGTPSTPTSLISASLSYESETSCFTSPQESPGHISLQSIEVEKTEKSQNNYNEYRKSVGVQDEITVRDNSGHNTANRTRHQHSVIKNKTVFDNENSTTKCSVSTLQIPTKYATNSSDFTPIHISPKPHSNLQNSTSESENICKTGSVDLIMDPPGIIENNTQNALNGIQGDNVGCLSGVGRNEKSELSSDAFIRTETAV